ncbi:helix-turn-helix domain-containing protein [Nocardiopsis terrae]|uniref:helix-turn-helix domain-containing protein n=1 Tax=Streptomyces sp. NPDC057554 TaxID=3350538 RepID=UPI0036910C7D
MSPELEELAAEVMTPSEVAELMQVSPKTVNAWLNRGRLRGFRVSTHWRVLYRDLVSVTSTEGEVRS